MRKQGLLLSSLHLTPNRSIRQAALMIADDWNRHVSSFFPASLAKGHEGADQKLINMALRYLSRHHAGVKLIVSLK